MIVTTLIGSAQKERNRVPAENTKGVPSPPGLVQADLTPNPHLRPLHVPGPGPRRGVSWLGVLGFSALFAKPPIWLPYDKRQAFLMDFPLLPSLGEQMLWVRVAAINSREITLSDRGRSHKTLWRQGREKTMAEDNAPDYC